MSTSLTQHPISGLLPGGQSPQDSRAAQLLDAIDGCTKVIAQAEATRLSALVDFLVEYRIMDNYTGPGCENWVELGSKGTPVVGEFALLEVAALLGVSEISAWAIGHQALD